MEYMDVWNLLEVSMRNSRCSFIGFCSVAEYAAENYIPFEKQLLVCYRALREMKCLH